jgi:hypothetical protein
MRGFFAVLESGEMDGGSIWGIASKSKVERAIVSNSSTCAVGPPGTTRLDNEFRQE